MPEIRQPVERDLAGAVTSVVVHPIVGKLVEAAGDALTTEFHRRFGGE